MQCRDAQFYLRLRRHAGDELDPAVALDLDHHLGGCVACATDARRALSFDLAIASAMRAVPVPVGLRDKLLTLASAHQGTILRRRAYRVGALAASVFLAVGLAFGLFSASRPNLDTSTLANRNDSQIQDPDKFLRDWLVSQEFPDQLPLPFDTDLLVTCGSEHVQGREVPVVVFGQFGRGFAKVYLVRPGEFTFKDVKDAQASHVVVKVIPPPHFRGVTYVIVHTGPDVKPFLRVQQAS